MSIAAKRVHNGNKRVCRRDIDYESLLDTGMSGAAADITSSFVVGRHTSAVADVTPNRIDRNTAPPIQHVTLPVGDMQVADVQHERHTDDMTLSVSIKGLHLIVKECIKKHLFRRLKFFDKRKHGSFSTSTKTVCGLVVKLCNLSSIEANHAWWESTRPTILKIHTDHRNNCIKAICKQYKGKPMVNHMRFRCQFSYANVVVRNRMPANLVPNRSGEDAYHTSLHGTFNVPYLLELRENMVHYVHLIDTYAPCVVSSRAWNNESNMRDYCRTDDVVFERHVLSISDEAFLLVVLLNYAPRWHVEYVNEIKEKMGTLTKEDVDDVPLPQYTYSRLRRQHVHDAELASGSGWSHDGLAKFNELAQLVKNDRLLRGKSFNHALYKVFVHRRRKHTKPDRNIETKMQKAEPYDDMDNDELSDSDCGMDTNVIQV